MNTDDVWFAVGLLFGVMGLCSLLMVCLGIYLALARHLRTRAQWRTSSARDDEWLARINVAPLSSAVSERTVVPRRGPNA